MNSSACWRLIANGLPIPAGNYCDQPYIVRADDGAWVCCITTGSGREGEAGQHVETWRSFDQGRSWRDRAIVEPPDGPEASYAVMLKVPAGRIYIFYNHNTSGLREVKRHDGAGSFRRVDSLGNFVFKFSDDHGRTWSRHRYRIPVRAFRCDLENTYGGRIRMFWNVGRPFVSGGAACVPLHKVGRMGRGFFEQSEGALLRSPNLLTEPDPERILWETLPEGDRGLQAPPGAGPIAEEQSYVVLSDGSLCALYRTIGGHPAESYSRDGGRSWSLPRFRRFADGRPMKHPRAAAFQWKCSNGKYLMWFHNHGGAKLASRSDIAEGGGYEDRNPAWLCGGVEADSAEGRTIVWSEPDIVLYDDDPMIRISYPDLVEENGRYFISETQKHAARLHEIPADFIEGLWAGVEKKAAPPSNPLAESVDCLCPRAIHLPPLPEFSVRDWSSPDMRSCSTRDGFSVEIIFRLNSLTAGQTLLANMTPDERGFAIVTAPSHCLRLVMSDGRTVNLWDSDPVIRAGAPHHVVAIAEAGPRIVSFVVDGRFCDGGDWRQFGWGRFSHHLAGIAGENILRIAPAMAGEVSAVRIYGRALRTWEAVGAFLAATHMGIV